MNYRDNKAARFAFTNHSCYNIVMSDPTERLDNPYESHLKSMAAAGSPIGEWYQLCLEHEGLLGDLATKGANAFIFGGFHAYIDLCQDEERASAFDALLANPRYPIYPHVLSEFLDRHIVRPAYEAFERFYAQHFGDPEEFRDAYINFTGETGLIEIRSALNSACIEQRRFELSQTTE